MRVEDATNTGSKISDVMAVFDTSANCLLASEKWIELFQTDHESVKGQSLEELLPEHKVRWSAIFQQCIDKKQTLRIKDQLLIDGNEKAINCIFEPFFHNDMSIGGIMLKLIAADFNGKESEKKGKSSSKIKEDHSIEIKGQEDLLEGDQKFRLLTHHSRNIICLHKPDGTYIYTSPAFEEILGYSNEEMSGKNPYAYIHPEDVDRIKTESHRSVIENIKNSETEYRYRHKDGHYIWLHSLMRPLLEDGQVKAIQVDSYPIQERKELEQRLRRREQQFRGAFEHSAIGMAIVGLEGKWIRVNQRICNMLGYTEPELKKKSFQDITHPEDLKKDIDLVKEVLAGKRENYQMEKRYFHKNGEVIWANLAVSLVRDTSGEPMHFVSQVIDITERKKAEKELKQLLEITRDQNDRLMNFAHIVSHNLRSHSSNISMLLELLEDETDRDEQAEIYGMIKKASANLQNTIDNLSDMARIKAGTNVNMTTVNLHDAIERVQSQIEALIRNNEAQIHNKVPEDIRVQAMPTYLDSILLNLFTNAIKYAGESPPDITFKTTLKDEKVILTVEDQGLGINLDKFGDQIFQLYKTFHDNEDARGIGLFITRNQVEAMGGSIDLESEEGEGTSFFVELMGVDSSN
jgi:PAS domain S-box-containing protein